MTPCEIFPQLCPYQSSLFSWLHGIGDNWRKYRIIWSASQPLRLDLSDPDEGEDCKQTTASADPPSIIAHLDWKFQAT